VKWGAQVRSVESNLGTQFDAVLAGSIVEGDDEARGKDVGGKVTSFLLYHTVHTPGTSYQLSLRL